MLCYTPRPVKFAAVPGATFLSPRAVRQSSLYQATASKKSGEKMSNVDFTTSANPEILATEVACLKATLTLILKSIGQADAGKVIINMERFIAQIEDPTQAEIFKNSIQQIKHAYRQ
jgi:hypothetical protein